MSANWKRTNEAIDWESTEYPARIITLHWIAKREGYSAISGYQVLEMPTDTYIPLKYITENDKLKWVFKSLGKDKVIEIENHFADRD